MIATGSAYDHSTTQIPLYNPNFSTHFGSTLDTRIEISAFARRRSSLSLSTHDSVHAFVFFDSQAMIPTDCPNSLRTSWITSAHFIPFSTSDIVSVAKFCVSNPRRASSCISHWICIDHWFALRFASSTALCVISSCFCISAIRLSYSSFIFSHSNLARSSAHFLDSSSTFLRSSILARSSSRDWFRFILSNS
jgi:hypothetical protein